MAKLHVELDRRDLVNILYEYLSTRYRLNPRGLYVITMTPQDLPTISFKIEPPEATEVVESWMDNDE